MELYELYQYELKTNERYLLYWWPRLLNLTHKLLPLETAKEIF